MTLYPGAVWRDAPGPYVDPNGPGHWEYARYPVGFIVAHHSVTTFAELDAGFTNPNGINSAHLAIDRDDPVNTVYQYVDLDVTAFHAGNLDANRASWGVETVRLWGNGPGTAGYQPITDGQYRRWHEVATYLAQLGGFPLDSDHLYPHNRFIQTTCPGDLSLARIIAPPQENEMPLLMIGPDGAVYIVGDAGKRHVLGWELSIWQARYPQLTQPGQIVVATQAELDEIQNVGTGGGGGAEPSKIALTLSLTGSGTGTLS